MTCLLLASPAFAGPCGPRANVTHGLAEIHRETPMFEALTSDNRRLEFFANPRSGSWTIVETKPGGMSCLMRNGNDLELLPFQPMGVDG